MDDKNDFIMTHALLLEDVLNKCPPRRQDECGKGTAS
jgi:hypothetical protein